MGGRYLSRRLAMSSGGLMAGRYICKAFRMDEDTRKNMSRERAARGQAAREPAAA